MSIASKVYERCAISIFGASKILLVSGGSGTGKTTLIYDLLKKFACDNFQFTNSILVCGINNALVDDLTGRVLSKIKNIGKEIRVVYKKIGLFFCFLVHFRKTICQNI